MTVPSRFGVLRAIAVLFKVMAWIELVLMLLAALGMSLMGPLIRQSLLDEQTQEMLLLVLGDISGIVIAVLFVLFGILGFLALYATGENIQLQLAIEENTRLTAALLLKLDEEQRNLTEGESYAYYGEGT